MNYILHQRDETVHEGIRTRQFSLEECINCHAAKDEQGEYIPVNAQDQFCSSCHAYASVNIDCFQCHATKPESPSTLHKLSGRPHFTIPTRHCPAIPCRYWPPKGKTNERKQQTGRSLPPGVCRQGKHCDGAAAIAPGVFLTAPANAKPADQPVSSDKRWGILVDTNKCA